MLLYNSYFIYLLRSPVLSVSYLPFPGPSHPMVTNDRRSKNSSSKGGKDDAAHSATTHVMPTSCDASMSCRVYSTCQTLQGAERERAGCFPRRATPRDLAYKALARIEPPKLKSSYVVHWAVCTTVWVVFIVSPCLTWGIALLIQAKFAVAIMHSRSRWSGPSPRACILVQRPLHSPSR